MRYPANEELNAKQFNYVLYGSYKFKAFLFVSILAVIYMKGFCLQLDYVHVLQKTFITFDRLFAQYFKQSLNHSFR